MQSYLTANHLRGNIQSAYRSGHSIKAALLRVYNDLLLAVDKGKEAVLVLLDCSAAYDTTNHEIFLNQTTPKSIWYLSTGVQMVLFLFQK